MTEAINRPFENGATAFEALINSNQFRYISLDIKAEDAMKLFLPPVDEGSAPMLISRPLPKDRQAWIDGFNARRAEYKGEQP